MPSSWSWLARVPHALAAAALVVAALLYVVPRRTEVRIGPLRRVEAPPNALLYPHPVLQLAARQTGTKAAWLSGFEDLRSDHTIEACRVEGGAGPAATGGLRLFVRSATHTRSFRISAPKPADDTISWHACAGPSEERRFVQFAVVPAETQAAATGGLVPFVVLSDKDGWPWTGSIAALGLLFATLPYVVRRLGPAARERWGGALLAVLLLVNVSLLWNRHWVDQDEEAIVGPARHAFAIGRYQIPVFTYPQILTYLHMATTAAYVLFRVGSGQVAFHDPYSNQLYFGGEPFDIHSFFSSTRYRHLFLEESTAVFRNGFALIGALASFAAYALTRRLAGERAAFFAGLTLALQPLLLFQSTLILANVPAAVLSLLLLLGLSTPLRDLSTLVGWAAVAGLASFKYNPAPLILLAAAVVWDFPPPRRKAAGVAVLGAALGFWLGHPSLPLAPYDFLRDVASEAYHYGFAGHPNFEVDRPWPGLPHMLYVWPHFWGNYMVVALAVLGSLRLLVRLASTAHRRNAALLLGFAAFNLLFLTRQFVQFGRNYLAFVALACVAAGLGADAVVLGLEDLWPTRRRAVGSASALLAMPILALGLDLWTGVGRWSTRTTAREQAIRFVNAEAALGARVGLLEPEIGHLQGVTVDLARFDVTRLPPATALPSALGEVDYLIVGGEASGRVGAGPVRVFGPAGAYGLPDNYAVYRAGAGH